MVVHRDQTLAVRPKQPNTTEPSLADQQARSLQSRTQTRPPPPPRLCRQQLPAAPPRRRRSSSERGRPCSVCPPTRDSSPSQLNSDSRDSPGKPHRHTRALRDTGAGGRTGCPPAPTHPRRRSPAVETARIDHHLRGLRPRMVRALPCHAPGDS